MKKNTQAFKDALAGGCIITSCSCTCGGRFAWMTPLHGSIGSYVMYGCICHNDPPTMLPNIVRKNQKQMYAHSDIEGASMKSEINAHMKDIADIDNQTQYTKRRINEN